MKPYNIRRVPWTCQWARFGLAVEDLGPAGSRVDDVFWACHNPRACTLRLVTRESASAARSGRRPRDSTRRVDGRVGTSRSTQHVLTPSLPHGAETEPASLRAPRPTSSSRRPAFLRSSPRSDGR